MDPKLENVNLFIIHRIIKHDDIIDQFFVDVR